MYNTRLIDEHRPSLVIWTDLCTFQFIYLIYGFDVDFTIADDDERCVNVQFVFDFLIGRMKMHTLFELLLLCLWQLYNCSRTTSEQKKLPQRMRDKQKRLCDFRYNTPMNSDAQEHPIVSDSDIVNAQRHTRTKKGTEREDKIGLKQHFSNSVAAIFSILLCFHFHFHHPANWRCSDFSSQ